MKTLLFLLTYLIIDFSPSILSEIQPDSSGYLNLDKTRQTTYYYLIQTLNLIGIEIIFFQKLFLSLSIVFLVFFFKKKSNIFFCIIFYLLIVLNIYYTTFSKTILTESIFFSSLNFAIVYLFDIERKKNLVIFGFFCGMLASLKPIGIPISIILIIIAIFNIKKPTRIFLLLIFWMVPTFIENFTFYNKFDERKTIFKQSVIGKLFILSGKDSFVISEYPKEFHNLLSVSKKEFKLIHRYLNDLDSIFLRTELLADYEVVAQYQTFDFESIKAIDFEKELLFKNSTKLFLEILKNNPVDYLFLSFQHYIGNWSIGSKVRFLDSNIKLIPRFEELLKSSGPMNLPNRELLNIAQAFFLVLFFIVSIYTLFTILSIFRVVDFKICYSEATIIFLIQIYLLMICLTNISTPRYLMLVYPLIILISLRFIDLIKYKIIKVKN